MSESEGATTKSKVTRQWASGIGNKDNRMAYYTRGSVGVVVIPAMAVTVGFALFKRAEGSSIKATISNSRIVFGGVAATALLLVIGKAGDQGAKIANGISITGAVASILINGQSVLNGISYLIKNPTKPVMNQSGSSGFHAPLTPVIPAPPAQTSPPSPPTNSPTPPELGPGTTPIGPGTTPIGELPPVI